MSDDIIRIRGMRPAIAIAGAIIFSLIAAFRAEAASPPFICDAANVVANALLQLSPIHFGHPGHHQDPRGQLSRRARERSSDGAGVIIDPSGIIVTNRHVIQNAAVIRVAFDDRSEVSAQLIQASVLVDLALLKVDLNKPLPALRFADSDAMRVGQPVIAIGNPFGIGTSVSSGVVSALNRDFMRRPGGQSHSNRRPDSAQEILRWAAARLRRGHCWNQYGARVQQQGVGFDRNWFRDPIECR